MPAIKGRPVYKRRKRVMLICIVCGHQFEQHFYRASSSKYCSRECWQKRNPPDNKTCEYCKKPFTTYQRKQRFCSQSCAGHQIPGRAFKDGKSMLRERARLSYQLREWREAVFKRDNYTCQKCGKTGELHAHHVRPFSEHPELRFNVDNGITYCIDCHGIIHNTSFLPNRRPKICPDCGKQTAGRGSYCQSCAITRWHASRFL